MESNHSPQTNDQGEEKSNGISEVEAKIQVPGSKLKEEMQSEDMVRPSLLSSESSAKSYRGLLNLGIILLVVTNFNLVVVNLLKYGILLNLNILTVNQWYHWPGVQIFLVLHIFVICSLILEHLALKKKFSEYMIITLQSANIIALTLIPAWMMITMEPNPASGIVVMLFDAVFVMKLTSYAHVNHNSRLELQKRETLGEQANSLVSQNQYPNNLTLQNLYFFIAIPTLCYQFEYPRTERIRKGFLVRRIFEAVFFSVLIVVIVEQYILPIIEKSVEPFRTNDLPRIVERLSKLAIPNLYVWLLGFYVFFHLYLNIVAEIFRYGDRLFYKDWWNSTTLGYFWRNWNMPVHNWMLDHVFIPATNAGFSRTQAGVMCFFISAVFHELVIAVPFNMWKFWAFFGMMGQLPLIILSGRYLKDHQAGNVLFWFSIVLGQPFLVLMIYRDWYMRHHPPMYA